MEYAEWYFRQTAVLVDGSQAGDHLESAQRQMAALMRKPLPAVPASPPFPEELDFLWEWFMDVTMGLPVNGMVAPTISWDVLKAWQELVDVDLEPWQAQAIVRLGTLRVSIQMENSNKPKPKEADMKRKR